MNSLEKLDRLLSELREDQRKKIVEGKKDREALAYFGITDVVLIKGPLGDFCNRLEGDVILLTDFDRKGKLLTKRLLELFQDVGINADIKYRAELRKLAKINETEELVVKYQEIESGSDFYGKNLHRHGEIRSPRRCGDRRSGGEARRGRGSVRADRGPAW